MANPIILLLVCLFSLIGEAYFQCVNYYPLTNLAVDKNTIKKNDTAAFRWPLGIVGTFAGAVQTGPSLMQLAVNEINNNPNFLPDVYLQLYYTDTKNVAANTLLAAMYQIQQNNVRGIAGGYFSVETQNVQLAAKIYNIPQISGKATTASLSEKATYPYFVRATLGDTLQSAAVIKILTYYNWTDILLIYSNEDYGVRGNVILRDTAAMKIDSIQIANSATQNFTEPLALMANYIASGKRIIVFYTLSSPGVAFFKAMNGSYLGPEYAWIFTTPIATALLEAPDTIATVKQNLDGAILIIPASGQGEVYEVMKPKWNSLNATLFPGARPDPWSLWYWYDTIYTFAYALDNLIKAGRNPNNISYAEYHQAILKVNFVGVTGRVQYDKLGDLICDTAIYNFVNGSKNLQHVGTFKADTKTLNITRKPLFWAGSTVVPLDGPIVCEYFCEHGTCVDNVRCECEIGYTGDHCSVRDGDEEQPAWIIGLAVGVCVILAIGAIGGFFVYRKKRSLLVKQVAEKQRSNINRADIVLGNRIGRGASGEVFKAQFRGTDVAVKKIVATNVDQQVIEEFEMEVAIMCGLRHPHIILFMGSCFDAYTKEMLLVMEYMTKGSLHDVLHNPKIQLTFDMKINLAVQAAQGMNFLHQSSPPMIHSDLKSHNILLDDKWNSKISDFGITKFKSQGPKSKSGYNNAQKNQNSSAFGTIFWSAPEVLSGEEHTEKADIYSFGVILWEILHRQDPYVGRDPVSVAVDVINKNIRPTISSEVSHELRALINACWHKDPHQRPSFQEILDTLRTLVIKNPIGTDVAPTGLIYLVNTSIAGVMNLWEKEPVHMLKAVKLHNHLIRDMIAKYNGYEAQYNVADLGFLIAFTRVEDAINFCIDSQLELRNVKWPDELLRAPGCSTTRNKSGEVLFRGLRARMSVLSGVPNCEVDDVSGCIRYIGPVVERSQKILQTVREGSVIIAEPVNAALAKTQASLVRPVSTQTCTNWTVTGDQSERVGFYTLIVSGYELTFASNGSKEFSDGHPHILLDVDEEITMQTTNDINASWIAKASDIEVKSRLGSGATGDYRYAIWNKKEVAMKNLVNQKLKEHDKLKLISDAAYMSKMDHPNVLKFHAVCLDEGSFALLSEFMPNGNLKEKLADSSIPLSLSKRIKVALDIANGMKFIDSCRDHEEVRKHDSLKSNNILIGKDWEVKVADYGQGTIKDAARTMTSIGSVAWTAPEILAGEEDTTAKIATYSFGIIMWELLTRQVPYANEHPIRIVTKILTGYRPPIPADCPPDLRQLIGDCLSAEPNDRPNWEIITQTLSAIIRQMM